MSEPKLILSADLDMTSLRPRLVETSARLHAEVLKLRREGHDQLAAELTRAGHAIMRLIGEIARREQAVRS